MSRIEKEFLAIECGVDECEVYNSLKEIPKDKDELITDREKEIIKIILFQKEYLTLYEFHSVLSNYSLDEILNAFDFIKRTSNG